jgi:ribosomal protein L11 methyltransferase
MKRGPLWRISVVTLPEAEDALSELFLELFDQSPSSYTDVESGETVVTVYLEKKPDWPRIRKSLADGVQKIKSYGLNTGAGTISLQKIRREDWAESWKRHFKPIEIGNTLLIKPSWSKRRAKKNQAVVILDPGLSFGTGQHPTTGFCLRQLVAALPECRPSLRRSKTAATSKSFLDIGTGSGILAISAAKLGYSPIEAFDFDPECVRVSTENAKRNRVRNQINIHPGDVTKPPRRKSGKFDVVCANLISNLLIAERERIIARLSANGLLVLAGILRTEFSKVRHAFEKSGMKLVATRAENEWQSGAFALFQKCAKIF